MFLEFPFFVFKLDVKLLLLGLHLDIHISFFQFGHQIFHFPFMFKFISLLNCLRLWSLTPIRLFNWFKHILCIFTHEKKLLSVFILFLYHKIMLLFNPFFFFFSDPFYFRFKLLILQCSFWLNSFQITLMFFCMRT